MSQKTIYILDDDDAVRRSLARLLKSAGYEVATFAAAADLLAQVESSPEACVVADLRIPGGNGLSLPARLRERNIQMPVIIVTADDSETMRGQALAAGAAAFFRKPVDDHALIDAIEWAIKQSSVISL